MSYKPLTIQGFKNGLVTSEDDTIIPDDALAYLENAYVWRKRLLKKGGYTLFGRLGRRSDDIAGAAGNLSYSPIEPGSMIYVEGGNTHVDVPNAATTGDIAGGTIDYTTGAYAGLPFPGVMSYIVVVDDFSPAMGIFERETTDINAEECIAFDRKMAYIHNGADFDHSKFYLGGVNPVEWNGTDSDFFKSCNYYGSFWATNSVPGMHGYVITNITNAAAAVVTIGAHLFQVNDIVHFSGVQGMTEMNGQSGTVTAIAATTITVNINSGAYGAYAAGGFAQALTHTTGAYDGIRWYAGNGWVNFAPPLSFTSATPYLMGAKFILPFKNRLLCFNTWEGTSYANRRNHSNRLRWNAALATPYYANVFPTGYSYSDNSWYEQPGSGGFLDAPTDEQILGIGYLKDYLVVLFERSSYLLGYTGNRNLPFQFHKLNSEFGCESSSSVVPFDDNVLALSNRGIVSVEQNGATRVDDKIPNLAFEMQNNRDGTRRIHGIRNFLTESVYWTYRSIGTFTQGTYPNRVLAYNYEDNVWAIFRNSFTCFGSHITTRDLTWDEIFTIWDDYDVIWDDARTQTNNPTTLAGNQQGYVFALDLVGDTSINGNSESLSIQSVTAASPAVFTSRNHNLEPGDYVYLDDLFGVAPATDLNERVYKVSTRSYTDHTFTLQDVNDALINLAGGYYCGGKITPIDNFLIVTKCYNPALQDGLKVRYGMIDLLCKADDDAEVEVQVYIDKQSYPDDNPIQKDLTISSSAARQVWHRIYPQSTGQFIQLALTFSNDFMFSLDGSYANARTGFDITSMQIWFAAAGRNIR